MSKENGIKFSGKPGKGLTFEEFDKKTLSWARKQYGNSYAKQLWENTLIDLKSLDLTEDLDYYKFEEHCDFVYDVLSHESAKHADTLYTSAKFWTVKWQIENRQRQYEKLFCFLETLCEGEAERQLHVQGVEKTKGIRKHFFERFGSGQPIVLQERVRKYMLGMPDANGVAFPPRVNMVDKLDQLEEERNYLLRMCPKDKHKDYEEGKESTLVRNILNFLPAEYDDAVQNVRNLMKIREMVSSGDVNVITNLDDAIKINYDTSWLPPYAELRVGLVNAWMKFQRRWDESKGSKSKNGHPVMVIGENGKETTCYGCGQVGHVRGSPDCKAGKDAVWGGAPKAYLEKIAKKFGIGPAMKKRAHEAESKPPCKFYKEGYCKHADRCNFAHEGQQGGSKRPRELKGKGKGKGRGKGKGKGKGRGKGNRASQGTTLVVKKKGSIVKEEGSSMMVGRSYDADKDGNENCEVEDELYNLMRGYESEEEEDEVDSDSEPEVQQVEPPVEPVTSAPEWGSSLSAPTWGNSSASASSAPEWGSTVSRTDRPTWGSSSVGDIDREDAEEWTEKQRRSQRMRRDEEMRGGNSPPPKLKEENLFSEGDSRPITRHVYRTKEEEDNWGWGKNEEKISDMFEQINNGSFNPRGSREEAEKSWTRMTG